MQELDTDGMKRVVDKLDQMGIAYLSISGGGEPLIRKDFAAILNYAAGRGMYVKLTSNGTMPESKYDELLACGVSEIAISLDGVRGNQLPDVHAGRKVLQSIGYLNVKRAPGQETGSKYHHLAIERRSGGRHRRLLHAGIPQCPGFG